jgi:hypothetical protein
MLSILELIPLNSHVPPTWHNLGSKNQHTAKDRFGDSVLPWNPNCRSGNYPSSCNHRKGILRSSSTRSMECRRILNMFVFY